MAKPTLTVKELNALSNLLGDIVENPQNYVDGICAIVYRQLGEKAKEYIEAVLLCWPKASGSSLYPIPAPAGYNEYSGYPYPSRAREAFWCLPRYKGEYGELRIEACVWAIYYINRDLRKRK